MRSVGYAPSALGVLHPPLEGEGRRHASRIYATCVIRTRTRASLSSVAAGWGEMIGSRSAIHPLPTALVIVRAFDLPPPGGGEA